MGRVSNKSCIVGFILSLAVVSHAWAQTPSANSTPVRIVSGKLPTYPLIAKAAAIGGTVHLTLTVQKGTVTEAVVDPSTDELSQKWLASVSRSNVLTWRFPKATTGTIRAEFKYVSTPPGTGDEVDIHTDRAKGIMVLLKTSRPRPTVIVDPLPLPPTH